MSLPPTCDILIIGSGNAGFCAAISAAEHSRNNNKSILIIDKCPRSWAGGNTYFTAGAFRSVHDGLSDLLSVVKNVTASSKIDLAAYTRDEFTRDLQRMTNGRTDARLSRILVEDSRAAIDWLAGNGVRFQLSFNRQAYEVDGRIKFWGGMALKTQDGGKGLIEDHWRAAEKLGVKVFFETAATRLVTDGATGAVTGVVVVESHGGRERRIDAGAVILAAGGFEANPRMRAQFLGPRWDVAHVRGTPYNSGEALEMAMRDVSAKQAGNWSGCHCVAWDAHAPVDAGDREISNEFTKSGYPLGIMVNRRGERFVDEGSDMRNYTYAMIGRQILNQPGHVAFQVWDSRTISWLRQEEYRPEVVHQITAMSIEELAEKCARHGLEDQRQFVKTIDEFNQAVYRARQEATNSKWDPAVKDGLSTQSSNGHGLSIPKSNWALPIDQPPFLAVKVTSGITFTFGGLAVNPETAAVLSSATNAEVPGLYCVGEMLGGIFYDNYPGGSGLTSGAVFGRRAGQAAAKAVSGLSGHNAKL